MLNIMDKVELKDENANGTNPVLCEVLLPKNRKCDWCNKRKSVEYGYWLGKFENNNKDWFICRECNLKHDIV